MSNMSSYQMIANTTTKIHTNKSETRQGQVPDTPHSMFRVYCTRHTDKQIEYFCTKCNQLVCPKCMYRDHNGHEMSELNVVCKVVRQNLSDLAGNIKNTSLLN